MAVVGHSNIITIIIIIVVVVVVIGNVTSSENMIGSL